jgi:hypothetical protein
MANLKLKNPAGGSLNLVSADGASDLTVTFPATTGTAMVSGNMPAFIAYQSSQQTIATGTGTKIQYQTKVNDTATCFNNTGSTVTLNGISVPAYSFAPNVAGYYWINAQVYWSGSISAETIVSILKNGSDYAYGNDMAASNIWLQSTSSLVYLNGTSDYVNISWYHAAGVNKVLNTGSSNNFFQGILIRAA